MPRKSKVCILYHGGERRSWAAVVRKAYKKKALETHPDRLPLGATPDQKTDSEDKFRKVYFINM
jgi:DnaJ-class molecular chaperone